MDVRILYDAALIGPVTTFTILTMISLFTLSMLTFYHPQAWHIDTH